MQVMTEMLADSDRLANAAQSAAQREAMVASQLRTSGVDDVRVIAAMASVPREAFVPRGTASLAYRDALMPLGEGRFQNTPLATARLLNEAALRGDERVLLIGAAGGYTAALLAGLCAHVTAVEQGSLAASARDALVELDEVTFVEAPLAEGAADGAPYDVIVIDGAVEALPDALVGQLREGGRIVTGLVDRGVTRLASGYRTGGGFGLFDFADVECAVLPGFARPARFEF